MKYEYIVQVMVIGYDSFSHYAVFSNYFLTLHEMQFLEDYFASCVHTFTFIA